MQKPEEYAQLIVSKYLGNPEMLGEKEQELVRDIADGMKVYARQHYREVSETPTNKKESGMATMATQENIFFLENGKYIEIQWLEKLFDVDNFSGQSGYTYYKTKKGNYVKRYYGPVKDGHIEYEPCTDEDIQMIEKRLSLNPEDEF